MKRLMVVLAVMAASWGELTVPTPVFGQVGCSAAELTAAIRTADATWGSTIDLAEGCTYLLVEEYSRSSGFQRNGLPIITSSMTINGNGATIARASTAPDIRIFYVLNLGGPGGAIVSLTLNDLTISGARIADSGGGLFNDGATVTLNRVSLSGNSAGDDGGGLHNESGTVYVNHSTISGNHADDDGGGLSNAFGTVHVNHSTVSGNVSEDWGGGVSNFLGTVVINNSTLSANTASDTGGGIINVGGAVNVSEATVSGNHAEDDGGGLANYGAGGLGIENTTLTVDNSTISENSAVDDGGGLSNTSGTVRIHNSIISGNRAGDAGGGVRNENKGVLTVQNSTLSANEAWEDGGGLQNVDGNATVTASTISGNRAKWGAGVTNEGGEVEIPGPRDLGEKDGTITILSSTLSGNLALEGGGGLFNDLGGEFTLAHSTVTDNKAGLRGGGVWSFNDATGRADLKGSIVAGNTPDDVAAGEEKTRFTSLGYNLIGRAGAFVDFNRDFRALGDKRNVTNPRLLPLWNTVGPTLTHPILPGSPALDGGGGDCPATDQRGAGRPWRLACDIGAFEANADFDPWPIIVVRDLLPTTLSATDGWDEKNGKRLVLEGNKLDYVQARDGRSYEVVAPYFLSLEFGDVPSDSTVMSVKLHITQSVESGFTPGSALWQVGGGNLTRPFPAMEYRPGSSETSVTWDLTAWVRTADRVNDLKLIVRNLDPLGKKIMVDQASLEVTFGPTPPAASTGFPVTLFVTDGWDEKNGKTLEMDGKVYVPNGSDNVRAEVESGYFASYQFQGVPADAVIESAMVYIEHHEEQGFTPGGVTWQVAGGPLQTPVPLDEGIPAMLSGELAEATAEWDVSGAIDTAAGVNDLKLVVYNDDLGGKKVKVDRAYVLVTHREP